MSDKIKGVFKLKKESTIGIVHTLKKVVGNIFCIAGQIDSEEVEIRYLGANHEPIDDVEKIPLKTFISNFTFQPYYFEQKEAEKEKKIVKHCVVAEDHAARKEFHSAEYEFKMALKIDEESLRANFGIGNVYFEMGEKEKAKEIFRKVATIDAMFEEKNKHFFNRCGIQLRKQEMYDEAINYYEKAIRISSKDENLLFNLARSYSEKGNQEMAKESIYKALTLNADFKEGKSLLAIVEQKMNEDAVNVGISK